jgi:hypothetical protein
VNVADLGLLATHFNKTPRNHRQGDFNGDAVVNVSDLGVLATNFNRGLPAGNPAAARSFRRPAIIQPPHPAAALLAAIDDDGRRRERGGRWLADL